MGSHGCELNVDFLIFGSAVFLTINCVCFELTENLKSWVAKGGMTRVARNDAHRATDASRRVTQRATRNNAQIAMNANRRAAQRVARSDA
jgi:hypothetical protein